jgi:hypothetical protein
MLTYQYLFGYSYYQGTYLYTTPVYLYSVAGYANVGASGASHHFVRTTYCTAPYSVLCRIRVATFGPAAHAITPPPVTPSAIDHSDGG